MISWNDYFEKLSQGPRLPESTIFDHSGNRFYDMLFREGRDRFLAVLASPAIETTVSRALAEEFNSNFSEFDRVIDATFNSTRVGGSFLHHNLDGSHTFSGAMEALRREFPGEPDFELRLSAFEHLARDFTTPSGINPFLDSVEFTTAKRILEELGLSARLTNDLLNFNAAELGLSFLALGSCFFRVDPRTRDLAARQLGRLAATYFFSGNVLGMAFTTAAFVRQVFTEGINAERLLNTVWGAGEVFLVATLLPFPLSVSLIIGSLGCTAGQLLFQGRYRFSIEMEHLLSVQFPHYRSYLSKLS